MTTKGPRFRLDALAERHGCTLAALAGLCNLSGSTWKQYRDGGVSERVADRLAVKLGYHPAEVWPEWLDVSMAKAEVECAADGCDTRFIPRRKNQRFCSKACRHNNANRRWKRERYRSDPEWAERQRQARRAYYRQYGDYERARQRRYDAQRRAERDSSESEAA